MKCKILEGLKDRSGNRLITVILKKKNNLYLNLKTLKKLALLNERLAFS